MASAYDEIPAGDRAVLLEEFRKAIPMEFAYARNAENALARFLDALGERGWELLTPRVAARARARLEGANRFLSLTNANRCAKTTESG